MRSTKIKIFSARDAEKLQNSVNAFLQTCQVIDIKYQSFHVNTKYNGEGIPICTDIFDRVIVIYTEPEEL